MPTSGRTHRLSRHIFASKSDRYAIGTDNACSEVQKGQDLIEQGLYDMRFSGSGRKTREELIDFDGSVVESADNFVTMEDPGSEHDVEAHKLMNARYGDRVQIVLDDLVVTQMRFIIPYLCGKRREQRAGTEGSSEFLPYLPLLYGTRTRRLWLKAGAPNGERNLQNYNPLIRAEQQMRARGIKTAVAGFAACPRA